ncbi:MAG: acyl-CoA dehydrogenase family protein [Hyphomicrobiales bacterium]|nr:acyl-CoA dehydrogenase family protein [Hyphomicrobiales bacterium]
MSGTEPAPRDTLRDAPGGYWSEARRLMREQARAFAEREVLPLANRLDASGGQIPDELIAKMGAQGYFGIVIPSELGGLGLGVFEYCLVTEQLARGWMSVASLIARGNSFYRTIPARGAALRTKIAAMAEGRYLGAISISEPQAGSDVANISCRAVRDGDEWVITGSKYWCTFADRADYINVIVRTDEAAQPRHRGLTSLSLEKPRGQLPKGVSGAPIPKIGYHGWQTYELAFDGARAPVLELDSREGEAFYGLANWLESARAHTAARSIGLAQGALEDALAYAQAREQFGRPIAEFQAIRFKLANMATEIEAARQLLYHVCHEIDAGERRCDKEAAMVKYFAAEMSERVTSEAMQIFGGAGYTTLHAVERYWRDARLTRIFEGSSEIQQRIIADALLGKARQT